MFVKNLAPLIWLKLFVLTFTSANILNSLPTTNDEEAPYSRDFYSVPTTVKTYENDTVLLPCGYKCKLGVILARDLSMLCYKLISCVSFLSFGTLVARRGLADGSSLYGGSVAKSLSSVEQRQPACYGCANRGYRSLLL